MSKYDFLAGASIEENQMVSVRAGRMALKLPSSIESVLILCQSQGLRSDAKIIMHPPGSESGVMVKSMFYGTHGYVLVGDPVNPFFGYDIHVLQHLETPGDLYEAIITTLEGDTNLSLILESCYTSSNTLHILTRLK